MPVKTTKLMSFARRAQIGQLKCLIVKYRNDTRYSETDIATHDQVTMQAVSVSKNELIDIDVTGYEVVCVDEGQFFDNLAMVVKKWLSEGIQHVYIAGLNATFKGDPWQSIVELGPVENIINLSAVCTWKRNGAICRRDAHFTARTTSSTELELVGSTDIYVATCRECFNEINKTVIMINK